MKPLMKLILALSLMLAAGAKAPAQQSLKTFDLGLSLSGYPQAVGYHDTCFISVTISNYGPDVLTPQDTIYYGPIGSTNIFTLVPTANIGNGGSQTFVNEIYLRNNFDTLTGDRLMNFCFMIYAQTSISSGSQPVAVTYSDPSNNNDVSCIDIVFKDKDATTDILGLGKTKEYLALFPNPASDKIGMTLDLPAVTRVQVSVKDVTGREVMQQDLGTMQGKQTPQLDISRLKAGIYFVEIAAGQHRAGGKFVKH